MLDVVDGEAKGLVLLEEAVEDLGANGADPGAGAARGDLAMEVVLGKGRLERNEHLADRLVPLVGHGALLEVEVAADPAEARARLLGGQHQLAVAAVLGWVECHG